MKKNRWHAGMRLAAAGLTAALTLQPAAAFAEEEKKPVTLAIAGAEKETEEEVQAEVQAEDRNLALTLTAATAGGEMADAVNMFLESGRLQILTGTENGVNLLNILLEENGVSLFRMLGSMDEEWIRFAFPDASDEIYKTALAPVLDSLADAVNESVDVGGLTLSEDMDPLEELNRLGEVLAPYADQLIQLLDENTTVEENIDIQLFNLEKEVNGSLLYCEPDFAQAADLLDTYADMISEDEALKQLTVDWADILEELYIQQHGASEEAATESLADSTGYAEEEDASDVLEEAAEDLTDSITPEDIEALRSFTDTAPDALREAASALEEYGTRSVFSFTAGASDEEFVLLDLTVYTGNFEEEVNPDVPDTYFHLENYEGAFDVSAGDGMDDLQLTGTSRTENGRTEGETVLNKNGEELLSCEYSLDPSQKSAIGIPYGETAVRMGTLYAELQVNAAENGGDDHTLMIDLGDGFTDVSAFAVRLNSSTETAPQAPAGKETDISGYDEEEYSDLLLSLAGGLMSAFMEGINEAFA